MFPPTSSLTTCTLTCGTLDGSPPAHVSILFLAWITSHHGFVVSYAMGKDVSLGFHVDDSEITLNVCLVRDRWRSTCLRPSSSSFPQPLHMRRAVLFIPLSCLLCRARCLVHANALAGQGVSGRPAVLQGSEVSAAPTVAMHAPGGLSVRSCAWHRGAAHRQAPPRRTAHHDGQPQQHDSVVPFVALPVPV